MRFHITYHSIKKEIVTDEKKSILSHVRMWFECSFSPCAKRGGCGRCRCRIKRGDEIKEALACNTYPADGDEIECLFQEGMAGIDAVSALGYGGIDAGVSSSENAGEIAAIDLGSTTIVMGTGSGKGRRLFKALNPQLPWGRDVISRLEASSSGEKERLRDVIRKKLEAGLGQMEKGEDGRKNRRIREAVLCCNTSMLHLLMGYEATALGVYPFIPVSLGGESFSLGETVIHTLPGSSAFIGSDITAGLYFIEEMENIDSYLYIDLGTNSEIVLKTREGGYYGTSAAAGSAADCIDGLSVLGPDLIHITAAAYKNGILDPTGLLTDEYFDDGYEVKLEKKDSCTTYILTQKAVRSLQLMKAAVCTAVEILIKDFGKGDDPLVVYLAGGFGYYLDPEDLFTIKMLPGSLEGRVRVMGNLAFEGAVKIADNIRNGKIDPMDRLRDIAGRIENVSLPDMSTFGEKYFKLMDF